MIKTIKTFQKHGKKGKSRWHWVSYDQNNNVIGCSIQGFDDQLKAFKAAEVKYQIVIDYLTGKVTDKLVIKTGGNRYW